MTASQIPQPLIKINLRLGIAYTVFTTITRYDPDWSWDARGPRPPRVFATGRGIILIIQFLAVVGEGGAQPGAKVGIAANRRDGHGVLAGNKISGGNAVGECGVIASIGADGEAPGARLTGCARVRERVAVDDDGGTAIVVSVGNSNFQRVRDGGLR